MIVRNNFIIYTMDYYDGESLVDQDAETYPPLAPRVYNQFAEVENYARIEGFGESTIALLI